MSKIYSKSLYPFKILDELKRNVRDNEFRYKNLPRFVFLCGKDISINNGDNRKLVEQFYKKNDKNNIYCIYAENLWNAGVQNEMDLLTFEDFLAEVSDAIILFVESFGTAAELGAFAMDDDLIQKMLVFIDKQYEFDKSFINEGPVKKILSSYEHVVYTDLHAIFSNEKVYNKLLEITQNKKTLMINKQEKSVKLGSFIIEILDLIALFEPINIRELLYIYKYMKDFSNFGFEQKKHSKKIKIKHIVNMLQSFELINETNGFLSINKNKYNFSSFMFDISRSQFHNFRSRIMTRNYRFKRVQ